MPIVQVIFARLHYMNCIQINAPVTYPSTGNLWMDSNPGGRPEVCNPFGWHNGPGTGYDFQGIHVNDASTNPSLPTGVLPYEPCTMFQDRPNWQTECYVGPDLPGGIV